MPKPPYNPQPDPLPGEVLVRFQPPFAASLRQTLVAATSSDGLGRQELPESQLIGARLSNWQTRQALPTLSNLFDRYGLLAADAIYPALGMWRLKISSQLDPLQAVAGLREQGGIQYAEADYPIYAFDREPNDPYFSRNQPALRQIKAPQAWDVTTGSANITVAILDTGLAYGHDDLTDKIDTERGRNFVAEPANQFAWDDNSHGTFVGGIIGASTNNNIGIAGVAWDTRLLSIKVLDQNEQGSIATLAMGLAYAVNEPVNVANMSTGGPVYSQLLADVCQDAYNKGLIMVAASGNGGKQEYNYPAAFDTVIAVGASDDQDQAASYSSYGQYIALVAPGSYITSLSWAGDRDYAQGSGTSFACPFVSGAAALVLAVNPTLTNAQVRSILENTADPIAVVPGLSDSPPLTPAPTVQPPFSPPASGGPATGALSGNSLDSTFNPRIGWGRLNLYRAVLAARSNTQKTLTTYQISGTIKGLPDPQEAMVKLEPGDQRFPDKNGVYRFSNLPAGTYNLTVFSRKYGLQRTTSLNLQSFSNQSAVFDVDFSRDLAATLAGSDPVGAFRPVAAPSDDSNQLYFNGHTLGGVFRNFWENQGKVPVLGYPISEEFEEGGMTVQYFERAVLEYHAEYALTRAQIQPRLLGTLLTKARQNEVAFKALPAPAQVNPNYFPATGHSLAEPFLSYWKNNGGLSLFGYPISEPIRTVDASGKTHLSQYFERCRMDYFPEAEGTPYYIQLGLLGRESAQAQKLLKK